MSLRLAVGPLMQQGAGGFVDPSSLSGLQLWYDADDSGTITASSGNVTAWDDKSGNSRDLGSVVGTPRTGDDTIGGLNGITFSGGEGLSHVPGTKIGAITKELSVFMVQDWGTAGTFQIPPVIFTATTDQDAGRPYDRWTTGSTHRFTVGTTSLNSASWLDLDSRTAAELYRITLTGDSGDIIEHLNGSLIHSAATNFQTADQQVMVGRRGDGVTDFRGVIGEIVVYDRVLDAGEVTSVEDYLTDKWSL